MSRRWIRLALLLLAVLVPMPDMDRPTKLPPTPALSAPCSSGELTQGENGTLDSGALSCSGRPRNC
jgi:hypothetical protein